MAFIAPKFRRESWYGRLYLYAYGVDRGWLARPWRMIGFRYAPYPRLPDGTSEAEQLTALLNWRYGREEAFERALAFLVVPPPVQPFVETGPKVSICPTFWKIVFAMLVYCPIVALRAMGRAIRDAVCATFAAIASAFRWTGRRFGRPLAWASVSAAVFAMYSGLLYGLWIGSSATAEYALVTKPRVEAQLAEAREGLERKREQLRQSYLERCIEKIRDDTADFEHRPERPDVECDTFTEGTSHEERAQRCVGRDEFHVAAIETVESGNFDCARHWNNDSIDRLFPGKTERKELMAWVASKLRERFAKEVQAGLASRARRIVEARKEDAKVVGVAIAELVPLQHDPRKLYAQFTADCQYEEYDKRWVTRSRYGGFSNATCATLAGLFGPQIEDAQSTILWQARRTALRQYGPGVGKWIGLVVGVVFLLALLIVLLDRYIRAIGRALAWFFDRVAWPFLTWTVIIATAPIWVPVRYIVWPVLCLVGRSFRSVGLAFWLAFWNVWLVRTVRSAFVSVFTGIASGIRRFAAATRQVLADTWHLLRAFASAKWERLCPFIEWN